MKKLAIALGIALSLGFVPANLVPQNAFCATSVAQAAVEDNAEKMVATGSAAMPAGMPLGRAKLLARRGAMMDAQRQLIELINGVSVDAESTMEMFMVKSDIVKSKVQGSIRGARIVDEKIESDGSYSVTLEVPVYGVGSIADAAISAKLENQPVPAPLPEPSPAFEKSYVPDIRVSVDVKTNASGKNVAATGGYTGVVIVAKGMPLDRTFCPAIFDENGRAIYGVHNVDKDYAISKGVVEYAFGAEAWDRVGLGQSRAGSNPLYINAVRVRERCTNNCDLVISANDADKILVENNRSGMLSSYAVVFEK